MNEFSKKIAIDIVILPPADIMEKLIDINQKAVIKNIAWGILAVDDFFPHISLAMGGIEYDQLEIVRNIVKGAVEKIKPIHIELSELDYTEKPNGSRGYGIRVKNTQGLQQLHEELMNKLRQYFSYDCAKEDLYSKQGEKVVEPDYINKFLTLYSFKAFDPHITIRTKEPIGQENLPIKFIATHIAACHVGIKTTCRKILFSVKLGS